MSRLTMAALCIGLASCALPFAAASTRQPSQSPQDDIAGTWALVSIYEEDDSGEDLDVGETTRRDISSRTGRAISYFR
jgi:hypothetical protein